MKDERGSDSIAQSVQVVLEKIQQAALRVRRNPSGICLVAATKTMSSDKLEEAYAAGVRIFGENRLQEAQEKMRILGSQEDLSWHFIGRMQRRKLNHLVGKFSLLHSVESVEQAQGINAVAEQLDIQQRVLLEVNIGSEPSKGGFHSHDLEDGLEKLDQLHHVSIQGLMSLPPWKENPEEVRPYFRQLCQLRDQLTRHSWNRVHLAELSMGMSHDYEIAIEEGATMVRIGTAIFGSRG